MSYQIDVFQLDAFVTGGNAGGDPETGIVGDEPSYMEAIAGYAVSGATRAGDYGAVTNRLIVQIGGKEFVPATIQGDYQPNYPVHGLIWQGTINVNDASNSQADTGSFQTHSGYKPKVGATVLIGVGTIGGGREFGGRVQSVKDNQYQQHLFDVSIIDWTPDLNKNKVFGRWTSVAGDVIFRDILRDFCPGFSAVGVTRNAASIPEVNASGEDPTDLFQQIADYLGWQWKVDAWKDVYLGPGVEQQASPLLTGQYHFDELHWSEDVSQVRTVVWGIGGGGALSADYTVPGTGNIVLPMDSVVKYRVGQWVIIETAMHEVLAVSTGGKTITITMPMVQPIGAVPSYVGSVRPTKFEQSTAVNIIVRRENALAIARMSAIMSDELGTYHDGRIEHVVTDGSRNEEGIIALADANLARFAFPSVAGDYKTWNKARSNQFVQATYPQRKLWGNFQIQDVATTFHFAPDYIRRTVSFTDTLILRFNDLLRAAARKRKDK